MADGGAGAVNEPVVFDMYAETARQHAYEMFAEFRERAPVHYVRQPQGLRSWLVTRYEDVRFVLSDPRFGKDPARFHDALRRAGGASEAEAQDEPTTVASLLATDPPDHPRLRRLVSKAFTPRRVEELRPRVREIMSGLLDDLAAEAAANPDGSAELVETVSLPLPSQVISELMGVPIEDREKFRAWTDDLLIVPATREEQRLRSGTGQALRDYFGQLLDRRRREARPELSSDEHPDLISALLVARDDEERLSEQELLSTLIVVLTAGHETTANMISNAMVTLFDHPDQRRLLQDDPSRLQATVEELLRHSGPVMQTTLRMAKEDVELGGVTIPEGSIVTLLLASANRDGRRFADPDRFDIERPDNTHLAFGHGIHFCLGAPLARMEAEVAIGALLDRFPDIAPAPETGPRRWRPNALLRGPAFLRVVPGRSVEPVPARSGSPVAGQHVDG